MSRQVLLVEDHHEIRDLVALHLKDMDCEVTVAQDGASGLTLANNQFYDLMVLDWMLPKISGIEICREVRRRGIQSPILILTAKSMENDRVAGLDAGARPQAEGHRRLQGVDAVTVIVKKRQWAAALAVAILLGGSTGEDGPHDWIYLLGVFGKIAQSHRPDDFPWIAPKIKEAVPQGSVFHEQPLRPGEISEMEECDPSASRAPFGMESTSPSAVRSRSAPASSHLRFLS